MTEDVKGDRAVPMREQVGRIIAPEAWAVIDKARKDYPADPWSRFLAYPAVNASLVKADRILALAAPPISAGG